MTFLTDMMEKGYTQEEIFVILFESEQDRKRRRMQAIVTETVDAHRLQKMRDLLAFEKLATWRRMNGFDRVVDGEDNWFYARSLPPTPQEFSASLRSELQKLKDSISMPRQKVSNLINEIEEGKVGDEEFAILKWLVEKQSREAAQAQVTVTPVDTVQHCSPCPLDPEPSPDVCVKLESNEGRMDPERGELKSSSAGTGLETPGQQCPPNEGTWDQGRITTDGFLTAGMDSNQGETFLRQRNERRTRQCLQTSLHQRNTLGHEPEQLRPRQNAGTRLLAKQTSRLTPVEKERWHRLGTRL